MPEGSSVLCLGAFLTVKSPTQSAKMQKKHNTKYTEKRAHIYCMRAEIRRQSVSSFDLGWEYMYQETDIFIFFAAMHMSKCVLILRLQVNISK